MKLSRFVEMFGDPVLNPYKLKKDSFRHICEELFAGGDKPSDIVLTKDETHPYPVYANGYENLGFMGFSSQCRVNKPAITISARGTIGFSCIRQAGFTPIVRLLTLIPKTGIDLDYLKFAIDFYSFTSSGTSQKQLTVPDIAKYEVLVPDYSSQQCFATFVHQLDKLKFILQKMIEKLELLKKSRFIELFGDPFLIDEKEKVPFKNAIAETVKGPFGSDMKKSLFVPKSDTTYKVFSQVNAIQKDATAGDYYISAEYYEKMKRFTVNSGDYIVTCDGTLGKIYCLPENIEKGVISSSLLRIALNKDVISNVYFETIWNMYMLPMLVRRSRNACLVHLPSAKDIGNLPVPIPNIDKQRDYDKFSNQIDKSKLILQKQLEDLVGETK